MKVISEDNRGFIVVISGEEAEALYDALDARAAQLESWSVNGQGGRMQRDALMRLDEDMQMNASLNREFLEMIEFLRKVKGQDEQAKRERERAKSLEPEDLDDEEDERVRDEAEEPSEREKASEAILESSHLMVSDVVKVTIYQDRPSLNGFIYRIRAEDIRGRATYFTLVSRNHKLAMEMLGASRKPR